MSAAPRPTPGAGDRGPRGAGPPPARPAAASSGAVLASGAPPWGRRVPRLAWRPPLDAPTTTAQDTYARYVERVDRALAAGTAMNAGSSWATCCRRRDRALRGSPVAGHGGRGPRWPYDNAVLGDGTVPLAIARAVMVPTLVLVGGESPPFKRAAADALVAAMPRAESRVLSGETTMASPEILAPVLAAFLGGRAEERARG